MARYSKTNFLFAMLIGVCSVSSTMANPLRSRATSAIHLEAPRDTVIANNAVSLAVKSKSLTNNQYLQSAYLLRFREKSAAEVNRTADKLQTDLQKHFDVVLQLLHKDSARSLEIAMARLEKKASTLWTADQRQVWRDYLASQRKQNIARLKAYQKRGRFPLHEGHAEGPVPIFVDNHNTACAVGHLMRCSGWHREVEFIAATDLLVYVPDVEQGPLVDWVLTSGLTQEEAALVQPGYLPPLTDRPMSELAGTNSRVNDGGRWFDGSSVQNAIVGYDNFQWGALVQSGASSLFGWEFHSPNDPLLINPDLGTFGVRTDFGFLDGSLDGVDDIYSPGDPHANILTLAPDQSYFDPNVGDGVLSPTTDGLGNFLYPERPRPDYFLFSFDVSTQSLADAIEIGTWFPLGYNFGYGLVETQTLVVSQTTQVMTDKLFYDTGEVPQLVADPLGDAPFAELRVSNVFDFDGSYQNSAVIRSTDRVSVHTLIRADNRNGFSQGDFSAFSHTVRLVAIPETSSAVPFTMWMLGCTGLSRRRPSRCE